MGTIVKPLGMGAEVMSLGAVLFKEIWYEPILMRTGGIGFELRESRLQKLNV